VFGRNLHLPEEPARAHASRHTPHPFVDDASQDRDQVGASTRHRRRRGRFVIRIGAARTTCSRTRTTYNAPWPRTHCSPERTEETPQRRKFSSSAQLGRHVVPIPALLINRNNASTIRCVHRGYFGDLVQRDPNSQLLRHSRFGFLSCAVRMIVVPPCFPVPGCSAAVLSRDESIGPFGPVLWAIGRGFLASFGVTALRGCQGFPLRLRSMRIDLVAAR
jgi:hypothetical protein